MDKKLKFEVAKHIIQSFIIELLRDDKYKDYHEVLLELSVFIPNNNN